MGKKLLFIVAHEGYQAIEFGESTKVLTNAGHAIVVASDKPGTATGHDGSKVAVDCTVDEVDVNHYDAVFFIGGPGAMEHLDNQTSYAIAQQAAALGKPFGAICISTRILAKAGALQSKQATGWDGDSELADIFAAHEVIYRRTPVQVDGTIVTAVGPKQAQQFGQEILKIIAQ